MDLEKMIQDSEISASPEFEVKLKMGNIFVKEKSLKNILLRLMKLILIFISIMEKNTS